MPNGQAPMGMFGAIKKFLLKIAGVGEQTLASTPPRDPGPSPSAVITPREAAVEMPNVRAAAGKVGAVKRFLLKIAGIDLETLRLCPQHDWDNAVAVAEIMILVVIYQTVLFALVGHQLWASSGQIRPEIILGSVFIAVFIMFIDSYMIMRSGWHLSGIAELARGGLDIGGGVAARIKAGIFLVFRIMLSIGLAQLTAIFVSLLIFAADVNAPIENKYLEANRHLVGPATALVDAEIQRGTASVKSESERVTTLSDQVASLRQQEIDPAGSNPQVQQAQREVEQLMAQKAKADEDIRNAETSAANEMGGMNGARAGRGLRWRAAIEQSASAKARSQELSRALNAARDRLDGLRRRVPPPDEASRRRTHDQRHAFEQSLDAETAELSRLKEELAKLTRGREQAIRRAIENAPDHVAADNGFLARISQLERIAERDTKIALVIILIDVISFGFELAAVLAKVTSYVPTTYAALLARDAYIRSVRIVDDMMSQLRRPEIPPPEASLLPPEPPRDDNQSGAAAAVASKPPGDSDDEYPPAPKRKRGRPRKNPPSASVTASEREGQEPPSDLSGPA
jgi:Domain of unknown function (DUF4407)